ncbi:hypothetical protein J19TS2_56680 [Cohnella xylanilytica]|nr:hypothetical protein J19TS2_56680 [Cohnella xylanilytica]
MDEKAAMWVKESNWITHMIGKVEVGTKESNRITHMDGKAAMWVKESNWITHIRSPKSKRPPRKGRPRYQYGFCFTRSSSARNARVRPWPQPWMRLSGTPR